MTNVKGNRKGKRRGHQTRRLLVVGGSTCSLIFLILLLVNGFSGSSNEGAKVSEENLFPFSAYAAEVEISADGTSAASVDGSLKGVPQDHQKSRELDEEPPIQISEEGGDGNSSVEDEDRDGAKIDLSVTPTLKYGTAWKKDRTANLVSQAIHHGFRHIDTACQPKHYNEAGVGEGWTKAASDLGLEREDIWIQTKFTSLKGQDPDKIPYDKNAKLSDQVRQSVAKSLQNLQTTYIDSLVMHGMESTWEKIFEVYTTMEEFVDSGVVNQIGISNFYDPGAVKYLYENARIKPAVVQNRFYAKTGHDKEIREFCRVHGIEYQSFWTLTANQHAWMDEDVRRLAARKKLSPVNLFYAFVMELGITPLDGTTDEEHMAEDMALMKRIRSGEKIFASKDEVHLITRALGLEMTAS